MKDLTKTVIVMIAAMILLVIANEYGSRDKPFDALDIVTGKVHSVTEASLKACEGKEHYSTVVVDGVERRCIKIK